MQVIVVLKINIDTSRQAITMPARAQMGSSVRHVWLDRWEKEKMFLCGKGLRFDREIEGGEVMRKRKKNLKRKSTENVKTRRE